jgi:hypothetical protein
MTLPNPQKRRVINSRHSLINPKCWGRGQKGLDGKGKKGKGRKREQVVIRSD